MSYCRWSSQDFACDLYAYEDCAGGYTIHVAASKVLGDVPKLPNIMTTSTEEFLVAYRAQMDFLETAERAPRGLKYDGKTFHEGDLETFLDRLIELKELGYTFPDGVIDCVLEELADEQQEQAARARIASMGDPTPFDRACDLLKAGRGNLEVHAVTGVSLFKIALAREMLRKDGQSLGPVSGCAP